jgi:glycosyltransferase involved in cell wall biosynthesis
MAKNLKSLYVTADKISMGTGGGAVTTNELEALKSVSDDVFVLSRDDIDPALFKQPASPFLEDYMALQQIKGKHFDLAHLYSGCFSETVRYLKEHGTKVSYTVAAHDRRLSIEEFQRLGMDYPFHHISDDTLWHIYTEGIRLADVVIAPSRKSADVLKSDVGCKNVTVIPHGIVWPKEVKPIPEAFRVGYLGAYGPDKGVLYLIQAWASLNCPDAELVLAGAGSESLETFIRQVANNGRFTLLGRVADVGDFYNSISVYVQPSISEGYGLEIPEAMSYGRPVIASEGAGASELISKLTSKLIIEGSAGFVVPIRNPQAIAQCIDSFYKHRNQITDKGQKGKRKARKYTWDKIQRLYKKVFLEVSNA